MKPFSYLQPQAVDEAVALLDRHGHQAQVIAGGQSLLLAMKERLATPAYLVSLAGLQDLQGWRYTDSGDLEVGAATTYAALSTAALQGWHREIAAAAGDLADRPVRNRGTIGGALCQADPRFDMPALVVGANASGHTASADGGRTLAADELFRPKGGTNLRPGEILLSIRFPAPDQWSALAFEKFRFRVFDAAVVAATCALRLDGQGTVADARVTLGAISPAPVVLSTAGQLVGRALDSSDVEGFAQTAMDEAVPEASATSRARQYHRELVRVLVARALRRALEQARS